MSEINVTKVAGMVTVSRELLYIDGNWTMSDAEAARVDAEIAARNAAWEAWQGALDEATVNPIVQKILDLHAEVDTSWRPHCEGCDADGYDADYPEWPCRTTLAITEALGIPTPD